MNVKICSCLVIPMAFFDRAAEVPQAVPQKGAEVIFDVMYLLQASNAFADSQGLWCRLRIVTGVIVCVVE